MNFDTATYELIENYLLGNLNDVETKQFEERLLQESQLKKELDIHLELYHHLGKTNGVKQVLASKEAKGFEGKLQEALTQHKSRPVEKTAKIRRFNWRALAVAASIAVLAIFLFTLNNTTPSLSPQALYAKYSQAESLALTEMGDQEEVFAAIESAFTKKDYKKTKALIDKAIINITPEHKYWFKLKLAEGIALTETEKYSHAENILTSLANGDYLDAPKANWYLLMCYLKQGKKVAAVELINEELAGGSGYHVEEMKEIRKGLN